MYRITKGLLVLIAIFLNTGTFGQQTTGERQFKHEFLTLINRTRSKGCNCGNTYMPPVAPLIWNDQLEQAAISHAGDMAAQNYFSHTSKDGRSSEDRIVFAGYQFNGWRSFTVGENIALGQQSIEEVMRGWFKSEGHCRNLMNPDFKEIGVARYENYWVQDFGGRVPFSAEEQKIMKSGHYHMIKSQSQNH